MIRNKEIISDFVLNEIPIQSKSRIWLSIISDGLGLNIEVPIMVVRGTPGGPVLGITAAVHGNELNGIPVIQRLINEVDPADVYGTIVAIPVFNIPSFQRKKRRFNDGVDLNHIMPGKSNGNISQVYAHRMFNKVVKHFDYLLDLHTASHGRVNSFYVRADMSNAITREMALLQNAQIIVNNPPSDGTLRGAAEDIGIHAITIEIGNPNTFQKKMIRSGVEGIHNILSYLNMTDDDIITSDFDTELCDRSYWIYTDTGGLLSVHVDLTQKVKRGDHIATIRNVFGDIKTKYYSPEDGIVIGKSISPNNQTGGRILHLGILDSIQ